MEYSIAPSALAYLFGNMLEDVFVRRRARLLGKKLPCRTVRVNRKDLANVMLVAAFVYLAEEGYLRLTLDTKRFIFKFKTVFVALRSKQSIPYPGGSLEARIVSNITGNQKKDDVPSIIWRLLGRDSNFPWRHIIKRAPRYLLDHGYFVEEERHGVAKLFGKKMVHNAGGYFP